MDLNSLASSERLQNPAMKIKKNYFYNKNVDFRSIFFCLLGIYF
jgi:hypothetical protein